MHISPKPKDKVAALHLSGKLPTVKVNFAPCFETIAIYHTASFSTLVSKYFFNKIKDSVCVKKVNKINESIQSGSGNRMAIRFEANIDSSI